MRVITYLGFTLLSIAIQFVVMDYIQGQLKIDDKIPKIDLNNTSPKRNFIDILKHYAQKPYALYYQAKNGNFIDKSRSTVRIYNNSSFANISIETSTDFSSTLLDLLYDENNTEDSLTTTSESLYTTMENDYDNITEITFFDKKKNETNISPKISPKVAHSRDCECNLLYQVCDINCCCDSDCLETERKLFTCDGSAFQGEHSNICYSQFNFLLGSNIDDLFCVVKSNLPDRKNIAHNKHDPSILETQLKWHSNSKHKTVEEFTKKPYRHGDPIWLLRNGTIYYVDLPTPMINSYCSDRKPLRFLRDETIKCNVKLTELEILQILNTVDKTYVISVTENEINATATNCTTLHCTKWTIILCDEVTCMNYNKSMHDPVCTDNVCTDLALKVAYTFYYSENKIKNATIVLFIQKVPLNMPFMEQEVTVKFVMTNESMNHIIKYSGNPGYITGLPLIVSHAQNNYTERFYNKTTKLKKHLHYPLNVNGICIQSNLSSSFVSFRENKRIKCRFLYNQKTSKSNETNTCRHIQKKVTSLLELDSTIAISPLGNPHGLTDEDWLQIKINKSEEVIYGESNEQKTKLHCYNLITKYSFVFSFADVSDKLTKKEMKILSANLDETVSNVTFNIEEISTVVTIDTIFIDETKESVYEYAAGPQLNIHLPKDFFFPFPSNGASLIFNRHFYMLVFLATLFVKKILECKQF